MNWLSHIALFYSKQVVQREMKYHKRGIHYQRKIFIELIRNGSKTSFGRDHSFKEIRDYDHYKERVPLNNYERLKPYIDRIRNGESHVLWPGMPKYIAKTSGTTSGSKYIPITKKSLPNHILSARKALLFYIHQKQDASFVAGKLMFLSGSPELEKIGNVLAGRLSGIVNHHIPNYLKRNQLPTVAVNMIPDWEKKVEFIVRETLDQDMRLISGIPPWIQMYFDYLRKKDDRPVGEIFKNLNLIVHGGVNFKPYKKKLLNTIGRNVDFIETYPTSEGFIAFQNRLEEDDLLLNVNSGIFYEFVEADLFYSINKQRITLEDVKLNVNYAIILTSNAGLWSYVIGDTVKFTNLSPYKIVVTGRISHFISAFGEHVIASEVDEAMQKALKRFDAQVIEYTVAPMIQTKNELPFHQWYIEFDKLPNDMQNFTDYLDQEMQCQNEYYKDLITGSVLQPLKIVVATSGAFKKYMKQIGKLGGQNKVPRLCNDRSVVSYLDSYIEA